ncbi:Glycerol-3-phosphate acyltransferase 3 [Chionoecetes opilio]|uniref:Glycerol-3-phosphate acyltransferase 3 n=1 Tax=Chionoecetes opilio TaxID=41210 RepID=A0A8J5C9R3_CHIOP|nr:Glycerol-3-phosphate acyltransferase 3 [Chionoecetes opilio]
MAWGVGILRSSYESLLLSYGLWETLLPYIIWGQRVVFVCLLLAATVGRRLRFRRKYVELLDKVFTFASAKLGDETPLEEEVEDEGDDGGGREAKESNRDRVVICPESPRAEPASPEGSFQFQDPLPYLAAGMRAVVSDCVTKSFTSAELRTWNMLSRTKRKMYHRLSPSLTVFWAVGVVIRYLFLFPTRVLVLVLSLANLVVCCVAIGLLPESEFKRRLNARVVTWCFDFVAGSVSLVARFHNPEHRPTHGIAVANHTSPIDCMVLATDQCYDMVGQKTGGILGVFMSALSKSSTHIWFERTEANERARAAQRLRQHAHNTRLPPILIFPEGCCVNNTAVMQFKKGAFELDSTIYPIAIRFDTRYGDAFWYQDTFLEYIFCMMTSWAIVVDVCYLPPMQRGHNESGVAFAQSEDAHRPPRRLRAARLDGLVKLHTARQEVWRLKQTQWRQKQQKEFARHFEEREEDEGQETRDTEEEKRDFEKRAVSEKEETRDAEEVAVSEKEEKRDFEKRAVAEKEETRDAEEMALSEKEEKRDFEKRAVSEKEETRDAEEVAVSEKEEKRF